MAQLLRNSSSISHTHTQTYHTVQISVPIVHLLIPSQNSVTHINIPHCPNFPFHVLSTFTFTKSHPHVPIFSCSLSPSGTCPVLCSSNGEYEEGACRCYPGWKGAECSIRHNECEVTQKHFHFLKHFFNYTCDKINARFLKPFWKSLSFRKYWIAAAICSIQEKHLNNCH